jgi:hypothetical protein
LQPAANSTPQSTKEKSALKSGKSWVDAATNGVGKSISDRRSVQVDENVPKGKLLQGKITGSRNKANKFYSLTLSIPPGNWSGNKILRDRSCLHNEHVQPRWQPYHLPYQEKNRGKRKAIKSVDEMPISAGGWNPYFKRMFPLKKEGSKIYTGMVIGHDEDTDGLNGSITWCMSNDHYFKEKAVQARSVVDCVWFAHSPANWEPASCTNWLTKQLEYKHQIGCRDK